MAKLNTALRNNPRAGVRGAITSSPVATGTTYQGGAGFARDTKSELFLLATTNFVGEDTFYEDAQGRDTRFVDLVRLAARDDPQWTADLLRWLRNDANMRSASIVGAIEAAKMLSIAANSPAQLPVTPRQILNSVLVRADEPGEALAYWLSSYGKPVPKWFKRALGDAILRLYNEYSVAKWDSERNAVRFADVVEFSQIDARHRSETKTALFKYLLDTRHGRGDVSSLPKLSRRAALMNIPKAARRTTLLGEDFTQLANDAGLTWEAISGWIQGQMDAAVWERCIDQMGYGALIKNLRNFDEASISKAARKKVADIIADPERVAKSRLLPMAFLNAYNNVPSDHWKPVLDDAATASLANVPALGGHTLVLIDTSGSMDHPFTTPRGRQRLDVEILMRWDVATLFGLALAHRAHQATVVSFSSNYWGGQPSLRFDLKPGENLLAAVNRFRKTSFINGGTDTADAVRRWYSNHDRVILLTDEQANQNGAGVLAPIPGNVPVYTFNLAGYKHGHAATGANRYVVGGLSDGGFKMIDCLEHRQSGTWPWDN